MNKSGLINAIAAAGLDRRDAETALNAVLDAIADALQRDESVSIAGFGTFSVKKGKDAEGINPMTGEIIRIESGKRTPVFRPGKILKEKV